MEFLEVDDDDPIAKSLVNNGITSFNDLLNLSSNAIITLTYIEDEPFPLGVICNIKAIILLFNDW